jgi:signal transduction histidine kinase
MNAPRILHRHHRLGLATTHVLVFVALATVIVAIYVAFVVGIGTLMGDTDNLLLSVVATAAVAVAFEPMRRRAQHAANALVFGERASPYEVLAGITATGDGSDLDEVVTHAATLLAEGSGAARVIVWRRDDRHLTPTWGWPDEPRGEPVLLSSDDSEIDGWDLTRMLRTDQGVVGAVTVAKGRDEPVRPSDVQLVDEFAGQAAVLVAHARLQADLQHSAEDLAASRRRLLTAQSDARQRLERDIHDGAQQNLVALRVKIGLAKRLAEDEGATDVATLLDDLAGDAVDAIDSLRSLARGVYPPLLEAEGLTAAITAQVRQASVPVTVAHDDLARHDRDIESTVYFCVLEALANAVKYAHADHIEVELRQTADELRFRVTDDGQGFDLAATTTGTGLMGLSDRLDAVDGTLVVRSQPGQGTTIEGSVPRQDASSDVAEAQRDTSTSGANSALGTNPMAPASTAPRS